MTTLHALTTLSVSKGLFKQQLAQGGTRVKQVGPSLLWLPGRRGKGSSEAERAVAALPAPDPTRGVRSRCAPELSRALAALPGKQSPARMKLSIATQCNQCMTWCLGMTGVWHLCLVCVHLPEDTAGGCPHWKGKEKRTKDREEIPSVRILAYEILWQGITCYLLLMKLQVGLRKAVALI